ncbi:interleukin-22 isoform X2 [Syngnathus scovelli]|uniref:interleukin-22 isoform X2 n=1 Tax=Syngnathus scovelli TaxID=161590 RepID=UPI0035CC09AB
MKAVGIAALVSRRLLGVLALLLIGCVRRGEAGPVVQPLSSVLRSPNTYRAAQQVSLHAQRSETAEESDVRLNVPVVNEEQVVVCCLHSNILDIYLKDVFDGLDDRHPRMHQLHSDLSRAGQDLKERGCNAPHYQHHRHVVQFRDKLAQMDRSRGLKKALSEVDMLFAFLHDNCVSAAR